MGSVRGGAVRPTHQVAVLAVLLAALGFQSCRLRQEQQRVGQALLRADSLEAAGDSTRAVSSNALTALRQMTRDSLTAVERRVIQEKQRADALDRALGRERIAKVGLLATVDSLKVVASSIVDTTSPEGTRFLAFQIDTTPYRGTANVTLPPTTPPTMDLRLALDPIPLQLRLGCGDPVNGIRPATATALGPAWASLRLDSLSQSPDLCQSPALRPRRSSWPWVALGAALATGVRLLLP